MEKVNGQFVGDFEYSYVASGLCLIKMTLKPKLLFKTVSEGKGKGKGASQLVNRPESHLAFARSGLS